MVFANNADPGDLEVDDCAGSASNFAKIDCKKGGISNGGFRVGGAEEEAG